VRTYELSPYQDDPDSLPNRLRNEKIAPRNEKIALKNGFIAPRNEKNKADEIDSGGNGGYLLAQKRKQQGR